MSLRYLMGTFLRIDAAGSQADAARHAIFARLQQLEESLSFFRPESGLSRVNAAAASGPVEIGADAFEAISQSLRCAALTGGAFDPTFRSQGGGDYFAVSLRDRTVSFARPGIVLDLGGFAKGWAMDRSVAEAAAAFDVSRVSMNFGGQLLFWSREGRFRAETVAVDDPRTEGSFLDRFEVETNCSVATSSQAERPGHLREPCSGKEAAGCLSATAVASSGAEAEALSTALFVAGSRAAAPWLERFAGARAFVHR